jgi:tetratricopeptide (TPR) repeat protein
VLESASVSYGKATPYFPVIDLLKRYCHIEERDDARTIRAKVTGQVLTLDVTLQDTVPALLALLDALPLLEQAVEQGVAIRLMLDHAQRVVWLSEAYLLAGRLEEAYTQAQRAVEFARSHKERGHEAYALRLLGEVAAHREPPQGKQAETYYQQALALAEELGMRPLQAHCHLGLGTLYVKLGRGERARAALSTAIDLYRAMEMTFWLPQAETALVQLTK